MTTFSKYKSMICVWIYVISAVALGCSCNPDPGPRPSECYTLLDCRWVRDYCESIGMSCCKDKKCYDPVSSQCCSGGTGASCPKSASCCDGGKSCPDPNTHFCCDYGNGKTCPNGSECCPGGGCCESGTTCCGNVPCCNTSAGETCGNIGGIVQCVCSSCWGIDVVDLPGSQPTCAPCDSTSGGCPGNATNYLFGNYGRWVPSTSFSGYCKHPTKTEIVGFEFNCEKNYDEVKIAFCLTLAVGCTEACVVIGPGCIACLAAYAYECVGDCKIVESCDRAESGVPIKKEDAIDMGGDWGSWLPCGG